MESTAATKSKESYSKQERIKIRNTTLMSIIPVGGQFYNRQVPKGILFLLIFILSIKENKIHIEHF